LKLNSRIDEEIKYGTPDGMGTSNTPSASIPVPTGGKLMGLRV
jgi:hypothetical protein